MSDENHIFEGSPIGLVRVLKTIKRRLRDGRTVDVEQAFHVKKAAAGDRYSHSPRRETASRVPREAEEQSQDDSLTAGDGTEAQQQSVQQVPQDLQQPAQAHDQPADGGMEAGQDAAPPVPPAPQPKRISVKPHDIPWEFHGAHAKGGKKDPVPAELRARFARGNKAGRVPIPFSADAPLTGVSAGDSIMWGSYEPDIIYRLRAGTVVGLRSAGSGNGCVVAKIESTDGTRRKAYMRVDGLNDPFMYKAWGKLYGLERKTGTASRLASAAYEVSKAAGFDDLVPPTVYRNDEYGDLGPILSDELIERNNQYGESLAHSTGEKPEKLRGKIKGYSCLQLYSEGVHTIEKEKWFSDLFVSGDVSSQKDSLNHVFDIMPPKVRIAFIRAAALDFLLWTGERGIASVLFCSHERHPLHLIGNELSLPDPRRVADAYRKQGGSYLDEHASDSRSIPMLWSDFLLWLAVRGGEKEMDVFEQIGVETASRMKGDRSIELARTLLEFRIEPLAVAGVLSRAFAMGTHSRKLARNPFLMAAYYADLADGAQALGSDQGVSPSVELSHVVPMINFAMSKVLAKKFDFADEMKRK